MTHWIWFAIILLTVVPYFLTWKMSQRLHKLEEWQVGAKAKMYSLEIHDATTDIRMDDDLRQINALIDWSKDVNLSLHKLENPKKVTRAKLKK